MDMAVGRLHLSISVNEPVEMVTHPEPSVSEDRVEAAFRRQRQHDAVCADRSRWRMDHVAGSRGPH